MLPFCLRNLLNNTLNSGWDNFGIWCYLLLLLDGSFFHLDYLWFIITCYPTCIIAEICFKEEIVCVCVCNVEVRVILQFTSEVGGEGIMIEEMSNNTLESTKKTLLTKTERAAEIVNRRGWWKSREEKFVAFSPCPSLEGYD